MQIKYRRNFLFYSLFRRFVCFPTLHTVYNFKIEGREHLPSHGPGFILSKHQSWVDLFVICYASRIQLYYVAKSELFSNLFGDLKGSFLYKLGTFFQDFFTMCLCWMGAFPMNRDNPRETLSSFKYMEKLLEENEIIVFFPEGGIVHDAMGEAKEGLIKWMMKIQSKKQIRYPVTTIGMTYKWAFPRMNLTCRISPPVFFEPDDSCVTEKIMESIKKLSDL